MKAQGGDLAFVGGGGGGAGGGQGDGEIRSTPSPSEDSGVAMWAAYDGGLGNGLGLGGAVGGENGVGTGTPKRVLVGRNMGGRI